MDDPNFILNFPWSMYSKKLRARIENPKNIGFFTNEEAKSKSMRLIIATAGSLKEGRMLSFYWLVDEIDGVIADCKFQVLGESALIGAADITCELLLRKNYEQARRISAELIDKSLQDKEGKKALPQSYSFLLNLIIDAIENGADCCMDIPLDDHYIAPPISQDLNELPRGEYPGWKELTKQQKISVLKEVIKNEVQPYVELDAGGVEILDLKDEHEVIIGYQGSCTSCYSATGATLHAIEQILRAKVFPDLSVTPDMSFLKQ